MQAIHKLYIWSFYQRHSVKKAIKKAKQYSQSAGNECIVVYCTV